MKKTLYFILALMISFLLFLVVTLLLFVPNKSEPETWEMYSTDVITDSDKLKLDSIDTYVNKMPEHMLYMGTMNGNGKLNDEFNTMIQHALVQRGCFYFCLDSGTIDFGEYSITVEADEIIYFDGIKWQVHEKKDVFHIKASYWHECNWKVSFTNDNWKTEEDMNETFDVSELIEREHLNLMR